MKQFFSFLIFIATLAGCQQPFQKLDCLSGEALDSALLLNSNKKQIFRPCREFTYKATYWDADHNLISKNRVWMMPTGQALPSQPSLQDEVIHQFQIDKGDVEKLISLNINRTRPIDWKQMSRTGIIETDEQVWMHPILDNHYAFTYVAPYPKVMLPLAQGKTWKGGLYVSFGWGDWDYNEVEYTYEVLEQTKIETPFRTFENCWHVQSHAVASFGNSQHDFWFDEEFGFVKMQYLNYKGQLLIFELEQVEG
ncbi:MAG: hypothetical protein OEY56_03680 [Cyclobacteriaceae bacterium]|nr:hypothetical protein [Cyclobacteriaceae bacterium]